MSNVIEFAVGERKVMFVKDNLPLLGAVLGTLTEKPMGLSRYGVLKSAKVAEVLKGRKITKEPEQVAEIGKAFSDLHGKGMIELSGEKVQTAKFINDYAALAAEVVQMAEKTEVSTEQTTTAKRGRPAGSVNRNPAEVKAKRFYLLNGVVTPFGVGKPDKAKRLAECDEKGNNIADVAAIEALYAEREEAKTMKVNRNPTVNKSKRFYLKDGVVTPFGLGKPGIEKLSNECTQAGEKIDNSAQVALMRQPKQGSGSSGGTTSKIAGLEAQIAQLTQLVQALALGGIPQQVQAVTVAPAAAVEAKVEVAQVTETKAETPKQAAKPAKADKPAKSAKAKKIVEEDPYETFVSESAGLDDEAVAFGSDGFVVTEIDC